MKKKLSTKILLTLLICMVCTTTFADDGGACGENLTWVLSCDSVLTISGTGELKEDPWRNDFTCRMVIEISDPENVITYLVDGDSGYRITYEQIVITAYIMENYMYNQGEDLFDWAYEKIGRREWHAYE